MSQKASHIFTLKSNLISQLRNGSINLGLTNRKVNQHPTSNPTQPSQPPQLIHGQHQHSQKHHIRLRSVCFSNVLQTIRKEANKAKEDIKSEIQREKQNQGIFVQAYTVKASCPYEQKEAKDNKQVAKVANFHSRSFLIRSCNMKKSTNQQHPSCQQKKSLQLCISLQSYCLQSAKQLSKPSKIFLRKNHNLQNNILSLLVPDYILQEHPSTNFLTKTLPTLIEKNIEIFVVSLSKKQSKSRKSKLWDQLGNLCNFVQIQQSVINQKQIFMDLIEDDHLVKKYVKNIVSFKGEARIGSWFVVPTWDPSSQKLRYIEQDEQQLDSMEISASPAIQMTQRIQSKSCNWLQNWEDDPYYRIFQTIQKQQANKSLKLSFLKIQSLQSIKDIHITGNLVRIQMPINQTKKFHLSSSQYPLKQETKLLLSLLSPHPQPTHHPAPVAQFPAFQPLQQKLMQYTKILRKQNEHPLPIHSSPMTESSQLKGKQFRKSLSSKSPYQVINELMRNNLHIHKQISGFAMEAYGRFGSHSGSDTYRNRKKEEIVCDNIRLYHIQ